MARRRSLSIIAALALLGAGVLAAPAAAAPSVDSGENGNGGIGSSATVKIPGSYDPGMPFSSPTGKECFFNGGTPMTCDVWSHGAKYSWNNGQQCYVTLARLSPGNPAWSQMGPRPGVFYGCFTPEQVLAGEREDGRIWWSEELNGNRPVNVGEWVGRAETLMKPMGIDMGIVPESGPDRAGVLGLPTWMWVNNPTPPTAGVLNAQDTAGDYTLTTSATWLGVTWDMGDGATHQCQLGTPYEDEYGVSPSPTCGHVYTKPGTYTVTATSRWRIDYAINDGPTGSYEVARVSSGDIRIAEVQVLNR